MSTQLSTAVADSDFPEIFDFLVSNGVGKNSYIDDFLAWTAVFVNSKKSQLRWSVFTPINKMYSRAVLSKIAVGKRAYRSKPTNNFCQSPEQMWGAVE